MYTKKINQVKIKRPRNAFIIYRQEKSANVNFHCTSIFTVSKILGNQWKNESESVREDYRMKAKCESDMHKNKYPDYVFRRRISSTISRRVKAKKTPILESSEIETSQLQSLQSFKENATLESSEFGSNQLETLHSFESILESSMLLL
jgi:hypothetical protein